MSSEESLRREVHIDGHKHDIHQTVITAARLIELVGKSPTEWELVAELEGGDRVTLGDDSEINLHEGKHVAFHTKKREHHPHHSKHPCVLKVVANTVPVDIEVHPDTLLSTVVAEALEKSKAVGQSGKVWVLRTEPGVILDQSMSVEQANIECGSTLYLTLEVGAAGDSSTELLVDPAVSNEKFEKEISSYRANQESWWRRGVWMIDAEFPKATFVFGASNSGPPCSLLAFGAVIEFSNYDLWPPSVRLVNPFTREPYRANELPIAAHLQQRGPNGAQLPERLMQWHSEQEIPFLCYPGVREYHQHPAHNGNDWLLHRTAGEGNLSRLLQILFDYGSSKLLGLQMQLVALPHIAP